MVFWILVCAKLCSLWRGHHVLRYNTYAIVRETDLKERRCLLTPVLRFDIRLD